MRAAGWKSVLLVLLALSVGSVLSAPAAWQSGHHSSSSGSGSGSRGSSSSGPFSSSSSSSGAGGSGLKSLHSPDMAIAPSGRTYISVTACTANEQQCSFGLLACVNSSCAEYTTTLVTSGVATENRVYPRQVVLNSAGLPTTGICHNDQLMLMSCTADDCSRSFIVQPHGVQCSEGMVNLAYSPAGLLSVVVPCTTSGLSWNLCIVSCSTPNCTASQITQLSPSYATLFENPISGAVVFQQDKLAFVSAILTGWTGGANVGRFHCSDPACDSVQKTLPEVSAMHTAAVLSTSGTAVVLETLYFGGIGIVVCDSLDCDAGSSATLDASTFYRGIDAFVGPAGSGFGVFSVADLDPSNYEDPTTTAFYCASSSDSCTPQNMTQALVSSTGIEPSCAWDPLHAVAIVVLSSVQAHHLELYKCDPSLDCLPLTSRHAGESLPLPTFPHPSGQLFHPVLLRG